MEETKGSDPSESWRSSDLRDETKSRSWAEDRETKDSGLRGNETGQIRDHKESEADKGEKLQRRSHETESRALQHKNRSTIPEERTQTRHEASPRRPGEIDCWHYTKTGLCSYGTSCRFNHPAHLRPYCKFFVRGTCKKGSACRFYHPIDGDGAEPMHQARTTDWRASESSERLDERRHESESSSRPEKRARTKPDPRERDPRRRFEYVSPRRDETVAGFKRARLERDAHDGQNTEEQRLRDIETQRKEDRLRIEQEMQEKRARDPQVLEEERLREIERKRREARMKIDQMKQTVTFDEAHKVEKAIRELGFKRTEDDGL